MISEATCKLHIDAAQLFTCSEEPQQPQPHKLHAASGLDLGLWPYLAAFCRHLRELLGDAKRSEMLFYEHNGILADLSRQRVTDETLEVSISGSTSAECKKKQRLDPVRPSVRSNVATRICVQLCSQWYEVLQVVT